MKKISKSASLLIALLLIQVATFATEKTTDVYVSRAPLTDIPETEVFSLYWVIMLFVYAAIVFAIAYFAAQTKEDHKAAH